MASVALPLPTLLTYLQYVTLSLKKAGLPTPDLDARLLLEGALQKDKTFFILYPDYQLTPQDYKTAQLYIKRRLSREPVAKILECKEFWSLSFKTTQDTLDPRPDSETLIEAVIKNYPHKNSPLKILDLGTGTGCLLLTLLSEYKQAIGTGADISLKALEVARHNAQELHLTNRASFFQSNWLDNIDGTFDIIVSNPPYIPPDHAPTLEPELSFDPYQALYGDPHLYHDLQDGLSAYRTIARQVTKNITPLTKIFLEFGQGQHNAVQRLFQDRGFQTCTFYNDLSQTVRCAMVCK